MLIGYARVSTQDQNLELQTDALISAGCKKIFHEKTSGSRAELPEFSKALETLRDGDTLVGSWIGWDGVLRIWLTWLPYSTSKESSSRASPMRSILRPRRAAFSFMSWPDLRKWNGN
jgi:hypothetical protein